MQSCFSNTCFFSHKSYPMQTLHMRSEIAHPLRRIAPNLSHSEMHLMPALRRVPAQRARNTSAEEDTQQLSGGNPYKLRRNLTYRTTMNK